jgi:hypothetical protein
VSPSSRPAGRARATRAPAKVRVIVFGVALLVALLLAACDTSTGSPAGSGSSPAVPTTSGTPASTAPDASSSPAAAEPSATPWPGAVMEGLLVLGRADQDIQAAGGDLGTATANEDLTGMWGAADGLASVLEQLPAQIDKIRDNPATSELAAIYDDALPQMTDGATRLRDAITAGDAAAIAAASQTLSAGLTRYGDARPILAPLVERAFLMQRLLVK